METDVKDVKRNCNSDLQNASCYIRPIEIPGELITKEVVEFVNQLEECAKLYAAKNHDYGNSFDKGMDDIGTSYGIGRIYDKVNRLVTISKNKSNTVNESITDTLKDLACYSIMMITYFNRKTNNNGKQYNNCSIQ